MAKIAGHEFGLDGNCMLPKNNGDRCWIKLSDIAPVTKANIGQTGWAHYGALNESEFNEIVKEVDRVFAAHIAARGE